MLSKVLILAILIIFLYYIHKQMEIYQKIETLQESITYDDVTLPQTITTANKTAILVAGEYVLPPINYQLIWTNNTNCWIWRPIGPNNADGQYISLGDIATTTSAKPPTGESAAGRGAPCQHGHGHEYIKTLLFPNPDPELVLWGGGGTLVPKNVVLIHPVSIYLHLSLS